MINIIDDIISFKVFLYVLLIPYHEVPFHIVLVPFLVAPLTDVFVPV